MSYPEKPRSNAWFLLPIFFGLIGGIIAFFILRQSDSRKARNCLYLGIVFMIIGLKHKKEWKKQKKWKDLEKNEKIIKGMMLIFLALILIYGIIYFLMK